MRVKVAREERVQQTVAPQTIALDRNAILATFSRKTRDRIALDRRFFVFPRCSRERRNRHLALAGTVSPSTTSCATATATGR
jgi:hypothetical protein